MSMLNTNFTAGTQTTNTKEESKMKNLTEEMLNIYNLVNESRLSKEKKAEITNSLTAIKETLRQICKENDAIKKQYVSSIKPRTTTATTTPAPKQTKQTPEVNTKHYYKPNMKFIPQNEYWLVTNTAYPLITPNKNYILRKEDTSYPNESAPDLLEYYVVYRPISELLTKTEHTEYMGYIIDTTYAEYKKLFKDYIFDGTAIKDILNTIADKLLDGYSITDEYAKYIKAIESFKEAVFTHTISID